MDISAFGMAGVAAITVICYLVGWIVKVSGLDNKWIPVIVGVCGGILGVVGMLVMTDFPAADPLTAAAAKLEEMLRKYNMEEYDDMEILKITQAKSVNDRYWVEEL